MKVYEGLSSEVEEGNGEDGERLRPVKTEDSHRHTDGVPVATAILVSLAVQG